MLIPIAITVGIVVLIVLSQRRPPPAHVPSHYHRYPQPPIARPQMQLGTKIALGVLAATVTWGVFGLLLAAMRHGSGSTKPVAGTAAPIGPLAPDRVCKYMAMRRNMYTKGWKHMFGEEYACVSDSHDIGTAPGGGLKNYIVYYSQGTDKQVHIVKLKLYVNVRQQAKAAEKLFIEFADDMSREAIGVPLPRGAHDAITSGRKSWTTQVVPAIPELGGVGRDVLVERDDWPTGKGYDVRVIIELEPGTASRYD